MEKKTALAQLNETLEYRKENCNTADAAVYSFVQHLIEQLKPVEREQIEQTYKQGNEKSWVSSPKKTAQEYYNETYKQE